MLDIYQKTRILDANARYRGVDIAQLMKNAGEGIAKFLMKKYGEKSDFTIICGLGNNGGDGLTAARFLGAKTHGKVVVYLIGRESDIKTKESQEAFKLLKAFEQELPNLTVKQDVFAKDIEFKGVVVEAILGSGINGRLYKRFEDIVKKIKTVKNKKVSVDIPIPSYKPDLILSLHFSKSADSQIINIGIPAEVDNYTGPGEVKELWLPFTEATKRDTGEIFVYGGSERFHGAPLMAIKAASKFVGSVYFYTTPNNRSILDNIKKEVYEFITIDDDNIEKYAAYADVLLIGPGLEDNSLNRSVIRRLFELYPEKKKVIDAYAIAMAPQDKLQNSILTPHRGELRHIWGDVTNVRTKRLEANLRRFAIDTGAIVVLKSHIDIIFNNNGEIKFNKSGNAGMAKGGTGDVLSGIIGAFATKNDPWLASLAGIFISGLAGDLAYKQYGYNYSATDLIPFAQSAVKWAREF